MNPVEMKIKAIIRRGLTLSVAIILAHLIILLAAAPKTQKKPVQAKAKDKCPVCGMFVARYPDFLAEILFKDGSYAVFDGAKDMFKYYFNLKKYQPGKEQSDIDSIYVTAYYHLTFINGYEAYYVRGSDIYGPMGKELIPVESQAQAETFMSDHKGYSILRFKDITYELIESLD